MLADMAEPVNRSWLRTGTDNHFDLHEPSRHYCTEKLDADHERETGESANQVLPPPRLLPTFPANQRA